MRLRADESTRDWKDDELREAIRIVELLWNVGFEFYNEGHCRGKDLAARFPGVPFRPCDALMGYLGATLK